MLKKNSLICLAAGKSQLLIIRKAILLGYNIIAIDKNPNALGFSYSTEKIIASTFDSETIIYELKKISHKYNFIGILNRSSGIPVITVSEISKELKLKTYSIDTSEIIINKHLFFNYVKKLDINIPNFQILINSDKEIKNINFPSILKPSLSHVGKSGIVKIYNIEDYKSNIDIVFKSSLNKNIIVQDYIEGSDIAMVSFVQDKKLSPISFIEEINLLDSLNNLYGCGVIAPARISDEIKNKIIKISNKIIENLNIINSPFMISFRVSKSEIFLIELHLDFGGDLILEELLPKHLNFDAAALGIKLMAGEKNIFPKIIKYKPVGILYHPGEKLNNIRDFEVLEEDDIDKLMQSFTAKQNLLYE
jgi:carbamoylphosphate synthase large subunit